MRFRCHCCSKEWSIPKEKLVYISDWPDTCPECGSVDIGHEAPEEVMESSGILGNMDKELEETKREKPHTH